MYNPRACLFGDRHMSFRNMVELGVHAVSTLHNRVVKVKTILFLNMEYDLNFLKKEDDIFLNGRRTLKSKNKYIFEKLCNQRQLYYL